MHAWFKIGVGAVLLVAGALFALLTFGPVLISDCSQQCQANNERAIGVFVGIVALAVGFAGADLARKGWRGREGGRGRGMP